MPDIERSHHALRLRWPWLQWINLECTWAGSKLPCDDVTWLFSGFLPGLPLVTGKLPLSGTIVGCIPLSQWAPHLFKTATRKDHTVAKEMRDNNSIGSIVRTNTHVQLAQYIEFWDTLAASALDPTQSDSIS
jgi:hypothetical protein